MAVIGAADDKYAAPPRVRACQPQRQVVRLAAAVDPKNDRQRLWKAVGEQAARAGEECEATSSATQEREQSHREASSSVLCK